MINTYQFNEIEIGLTAEFSHHITNDMQKSFCIMSGDVNPLHTDDLFAKERNFPSPVVYGMLVASLYSTLVGVYLPGRYCLLRGINIDFAKPVYIGDVLKIKGAVIDKHDIFKMITVKADIINQDNVKVSRAKIEVGVLDD